MKKNRDLSVHNISQRRPSECDGVWELGCRDSTTFKYKDRISFSLNTSSMEFLIWAAAAAPAWVTDLSQCSL